MLVLTDAELVESARSGDEKAFEALVEKHRARIDATISSFITNAQDREDIAQETFISAYRNLHQLSNPDRFSYWLVTIAQNRCRNWLNKHRSQTIPIDEVDENLLSSDNSPEREFIEAEQQQIIAQAIETLPETERQVASAHYLEGESHKELVNRHGISYQAVCARLSRAKQKLAKRLGHLLTGVFVSPITTLKQIYSGGVTVMKVGTASKITAGVVAIIVLTFIGTRQFMSSKEDSSPSVKIVTSTESANSITQRDSVHKSTVTAPSREDKPQISAEEMQQIEDFFAQLEGADAQSGTGTSQQAREAASNQDSYANEAADSLATSVDAIQPAEDAMNAYLEAFRNFDVAAMRSFMTGAAKEGFESSLPAFRMMNGEFPEEVIEEVVNSGLPEEAIDGGLQMARGIMQTISKQMFSQAVIVSSEYVGDEFHFRLRLSSPELPEILEIVGLDISDVPEMPEIPDYFHKMRKENGVWQIYE